MWELLIFKMLTQSFLKIPYRPIKTFPWLNLTQWCHVKSLVCLNNLVWGPLHHWPPHACWERGHFCAIVSCSYPKPDSKPWTGILWDHDPHKRSEKHQLHLSFWGDSGGLLAPAGVLFVKHVSAHQHWGSSRWFSEERDKLIPIPVSRLLIQEILKSVCTISLKCLFRSNFWTLI